MTTTDHDQTRVLRRWLEDGPSPDELPDSVFDAVMGEVPSVRRRAARWPGLARPSANLMARVGVAAAAVVLAVWAAVNVPGLVNVAAPDPSPTESVDPGTDVRSTLQNWASQVPPPGTYRLDEPFPLRVTMTLPEDIEIFSAHADFGGLCLRTCEPDEVGLDFWIVEHGYADPCRVEGGLLEPPLGPTVDDFVDYVTGQELLEVRENSPTIVSGYVGRYLETETAGDLTACSSEMLRLYGAQTPNSTIARLPSPGDVDRIWVLDVDGVRLVVDLFVEPDTPADDVAVLQGIVDSLRIEPGD